MPLDHITKTKESKRLDAVLICGPSKPFKQVTVVATAIAPSEKSLPVQDAVLGNPDNTGETSSEPVAIDGSVAPGRLVEVCSAATDMDPTPQDALAVVIGSSSAVSSSPEEASGGQSSGSGTSLVVSEVRPPPRGTQSSPGVSSGSSKSATQKQAKIYSVTLGEVSQVYSSGSLKLQFEYAGNSRQQEQSKGSQKQLSFKAEWLSSQDVERFRMRGVVAIDLDNLTEKEVSYSTNGDDDIYLGHGGGVLKLTMQSA